MRDKSEDEFSYNDVVYIEGYVIVSSLINHYFHYIYGTRLWGLHHHVTLEKVANSTILWMSRERPIQSPSVVHNTFGSCFAKGHAFFIN